MKKLMRSGLSLLVSLYCFSFKRLRFLHWTQSLLIFSGKPSGDTIRLLISKKANLSRVILIFSMNGMEPNGILPRKKTWMRSSNPPKATLPSMEDIAHGRSVRDTLPVLIPKPGTYTKGSCI